MSRKLKRELFFAGAALGHVEAALYSLAPDGLWAPLWGIGHEAHGLEYYPPTRHTWHVFGLDELEQARSGIIDLFEMPTGTRAVFEDGCDPWGLPAEPIGAALAALADALTDVLTEQPETDGGPQRPGNIVTCGEVTMPWNELDCVTLRIDMKTAERIMMNWCSEFQLDRISSGETLTSQTVDIWPSTRQVEFRGDAEEFVVIVKSEGSECQKSTAARIALNPESHGTCTASYFAQEGAADETSPALEAVAEFWDELVSEWRKVERSGKSTEADSNSPRQHKPTDTASTTLPLRRAPGAETTFTLNTTSSLFLRWVWKQSQRYYGVGWPVGDGSLAIGGGSFGDWYGNKPEKWGPSTVIQYPIEGEPHITESFFVDSAFSFDCTPLADAPERVQVTAQCLDYPEAKAILRELLADVARAYPEAEAQLVTMLGSSNSEPEADADTPADPSPWDCINKLRDRDLVRLWWEGLNAGEICSKLKAWGYTAIQPKTVTNRITELRSMFGEAVVPYRQRPKNQDSEGPESG